MLSLFVQLIGCALLSWNAITKSSRFRAFEAQLSLPSSVELSKSSAILKQKEYFFNVVGFLILFIGYLIPILSIDIQIIGLFRNVFLLITTIFLFYLIISLIGWIAILTSDFLIEASKKKMTGVTYLYANNNDSEDESNSQQR